MSPFKRHFPTQSGNIERCTELTADSKKDFFDAMDKVGDDSTALMETAKDYFRQRKFRGGTVNLDKGTRLGRLHQITAIERDLAKAARGNVSPSETPALKPYRDDFETGDSAVKANAVDEVLDLIRHLPFGPLVWIFSYEDSEKPFANSSLAELPCRLGLEHLEATLYFPVELLVPITAALKKPTAFDAGLDEFWCPGGRTCPRENCLDKSGFEEVVAQGYDKVARPNGLTFGNAKAPDFNSVNLTGKP